MNLLGIIGAVLGGIIGAAIWGLIGPKKPLTAKPSRRPNADPCPRWLPQRQQLQKARSETWVSLLPELRVQFAARCSLVADFDS